MELSHFKQQFVRTELGITESFGRVTSFIDFGNVNHWFEQDRQDAESRPLADDQKLRISLAGVKEFADLFSQDVRFYYGHDPDRDGSVKFISATKSIFGRHRVFTKLIQYVRHHLREDEIFGNTRPLWRDNDGQFIRIPKCNFDVEIAVDAIRLLGQYDTLALFSSDADFVALARHLQKQGKKIVLIKGGNITRNLREAVNLVVNAQRIKKHLTTIEKQKPGARPGLANRNPYPRAGS